MLDKKPPLPNRGLFVSACKVVLTALGIFVLLGCLLTNEFLYALQNPVTSTLQGTDSSRISVTVTAQPSLTPRPTFTSLPSYTATFTSTPTFTLLPPTPTDTSSPTPTPLPPTLTPGPGQLTSGYEVWSLIYSEISPQITIWEYTFPPFRFSPNQGAGYQFLRLEFYCTTGAPLTSLLTNGIDQGLTLLGKQEGFSDIFIRDQLGKEYPVQYIGSCWLAAPVDPTQSGFILYFLGLNPLPVYPR
jgi:hypothetical protein